jgi:hypothetical protein
MTWAGTATLLLVLPLAVTGTATQSSSAHKRSSNAAPVSGKKAARASSKSRAGVRRRYARPVRAKQAAAPAYQLHPDPERYQEIQKALAARGYFKGEVNGVWGPDSVEALQRFQTDNKLPNDGKINSLSLIGLGLGPKHDSLPQVTSGSGNAAAASGGAANKQAEDAR